MLTWLRGAVPVNPVTYAAKVPDIPLLKKLISSFAAGAAKMTRSVTAKSTKNHLLLLR